MSNQNMLLAIAGLVIGAVAGAGIVALMAEPKTVEVPTIQEVQKQLTADELAALCSDQLKDERASLQEAQTKVVDLQTQLDQREKELAEMKKQDEKDATRRAAASQKMKDMEAEIATLRGQLAQAEKERDELVVELKQTVQKLEAQIKETEVQRARAEKYKDESQENLWTTFSAEAKVNICDRGTRRRHDKCHEAVDEALGAAAIKDRFITCVDTYQATPQLIQGDRKTALPANAVWMNEDSRFTDNGWYIQFCDPTLPEANPDGAAADRAALAAPTGVQPGSASDDAPEDQIPAPK